MNEKIKKYLPDIIIFIGIWLYLDPIYSVSHYDFPFRKVISTSSHVDWTEIGIIIILIGADILIRKYLFSKNEKK